MYVEEDIDVTKNYTLHSVDFTLQNENIYIEHIVNIQMIQLVCELNKKFIENFFIRKIDENMIHVFIVSNHLFKDIGFPQYFFKLIISFDSKANQFQIKSCDKLTFELPFQYNPKSTQFDLNLIVDYVKVNDHQYDFKTNIEYCCLENIDNVTQNIIIKIINTLFNNLKKGINQYVC